MVKQYIDKSAVVAEIENIEADAICQYKSDKSRYAEGVIDVIHRIKHLFDTLEVKDVDAIRRNWYNQGYLKGRREANIPAIELGLPSELNTLEVKKVDLEKEVEAYRSTFYWDEDLYKLAKHFFELGLKAQKGE